MEFEPIFERCRVRCPECGRLYVIIVAEDEDSPLICDVCGTPGLRVMSRDPVAWDGMITLSRNAAK